MTVLLHEGSIFLESIAYGNSEKILEEFEYDYCIETLAYLSLSISESTDHTDLQDQKNLAIYKNAVSSLAAKAKILASRLFQSDRDLRDSDIVGQMVLRICHFKQLLKDEVVDRLPIRRYKDDLLCLIYPKFNIQRLSVIDLVVTEVDEVGKRSSTELELHLLIQWLTYATISMIESDTEGNKLIKLDDSQPENQIDNYFFYSYYKEVETAAIARCNLLGFNLITIPRYAQIYMQLYEKRLNNRPNCVIRPPIRHYQVTDDGYPLEWPQFIIADSDNISIEGPDWLEPILKENEADVFSFVESLLPRSSKRFNDKETNSNDEPLPQLFIKNGSIERVEGADEDVKLTLYRIIPIKDISDFMNERMSLFHAKCSFTLMKNPIKRLLHAMKFKTREKYIEEIVNNPIGSQCYSKARCSLHIWLPNNLFFGPANRWDYEQGTRILQSCEAIIGINCMAEFRTVYEQLSEFNRRLNQYRSDESTHTDEPSFYRNLFANYDDIGVKLCDEAELVHSKLRSLLFVSSPQNPAPWNPKQWQEDKNKEKPWSIKKMEAAEESSEHAVKTKGSGMKSENAEKKVGEQVETIDEKRSEKERQDSAITFRIFNNGTEIKCTFRETQADEDVEINDINDYIRVIEKSCLCIPVDVIPLFNGTNGELITLIHPQGEKPNANKAQDNATQLF